MEISEPTLLAKLPRAGTSEEGSRKFSQVYGLRDGRTKKRNEVCAAIDGNSMNVFEVRYVQLAEEFTSHDYSRLSMVEI